MKTLTCADCNREATSDEWFGLGLRSDQVLDSRTWEWRCGCKRESGLHWTGQIEVAQRPSGIDSGLALQEYAERNPWARASTPAGELQRAVELSEMNVYQRRALEQAEEFERFFERFVPEALRAEADSELNRLLETYFDG